MLKSKILKNFKFFLPLTVSLIFTLNFYVNSEELSGKFIQGGLIFGETNSDNKVYFNDLKIPIDENGNFLIGISRMHPKNGVIKIYKPNDEIKVINISVKQRIYKIQRINNLDKAKVTPPEEFFSRIEKEGLKIKSAKKQKVDKSYYNSGFIMPAKGIITGVYGSQRILNGIPKRPHFGIDIANKLGSPIISPADGIVVMAEKDLYFSGGTIIISHGRGLTSSLLHLKKLLVKKGDTVKKGQLIGLMGATGRATGSHLDWRMEIRGVRIDPELILER